MHSSDNFIAGLVSKAQHKQPSMGVFVPLDDTDDQSTVAMCTRKAFRSVARKHADRNTFGVMECGSESSSQRQGSPTIPCPNLPASIWEATGFTDVIDSERPDYAGTYSGGICMKNHF